MTYYDILKSSKITCLDGIKQGNEKDLEIFKKTLPLKENPLLWSLLSIVYADTISNNIENLFNNNNIYSNVFAYKIGDYKVDSIYKDVIFTLSRGSLVVGIIKTLMERLNVENPFDILFHDPQSIDMVDIINDVIYSNGGEFYGMYYHNYMLKEGWINKKDINIHRFKITKNDVHNAISKIEYIKRTYIHPNLIFLQNYPPLFYLKHEGGKIIESNSENSLGGWIFFLTEDHVNEFIKKQEEKAISDISTSILYRYRTSGKEIYEKGIKAEKKKKKRAQKELRTMKTLISVP